jgi:hypothetical protein
MILGGRCAAAALEKMAELIELGHADVVVNDLDGQLVDHARLETEAASPLANRARKAARGPPTHIDERLPRHPIP